MAEPAPSPAALFAQATRRHPDDRQARNDLYLELLRRHGHIVRKGAPGAGEGLPCGWPNSPRRAAAAIRVPRDTPLDQVAQALVAGLDAEEAEQ